MIKVTPDNVEVVIYHSPCHDGFSSALTVCKYRMENKKVDTQPQFVGWSHSTPGWPKHQVEGKRVVLLDFSFPPEVMDKLTKCVAGLLILDHHASAKDALENLPQHQKVFDMNRSGVGITWDWCYPEIPLPRFMAMIQDRDLWRFEIPGTRAFHECLVCEQDCRNDRFEAWYKYFDEQVLDEKIKEYDVYLSILDRVYHNISARPEYIIQRLPPNNTPQVVGYINCGSYKSELGDIAVNVHPWSNFASVWSYSHLKDLTHHSLRSTDKKTDVGALAAGIAHFGSSGGGHRNAAGWTKRGCNPLLPGEVVTWSREVVLMLLRMKDGVVSFSDEDCDRCLHSSTEVLQLLAAKGVKKVKYSEYKLVTTCSKPDKHRKYDVVADLMSDGTLITKESQLSKDSFIFESWALEVLRSATSSVSSFFDSCVKSHTTSAKAGAILSLIYEGRGTLGHTEQLKQLHSRLSYISPNFLLTWDSPDDTLMEVVVLRDGTLTKPFYTTVAW